MDKLVQWYSHGRDVHNNSETRRLAHCIYRFPRPFRRFPVLEYILPCLPSVLFDIRIPWCSSSSTTSHSSQLLLPWFRFSLACQSTVGVLLPVILFAICCISAFTIAGGFSSQISSAPGDEVLINGKQCGIAYWPNSTIEGAANTKPYSMAFSRYNDAANYTQQCYSSTSSRLLDCDKFVVQTLPTAITKNDSSCPFQGNICRSNNTNLLLDTGYIDSNNELGLNYPENQRFRFRYVLQCAPLITQGYTSRVTIGNTTWVRYNYGSLDSGNTTLYNFTY